ncbi:hypothetical protein TIFTF001_003994 [Ficus carica]|uniref:Uncharacterized protein n=1 Tax=Ficus carica TaxID=3494 RepID=A0AA87ZH43_FICCA|nr:hypothetical protein TIFTF001_003994 [Ficus carica]
MEGDEMGSEKRQWKEGILEKQEVSASGLRQVEIGMG